ncbi:MAG: ygjT1 [Myxococcaceae bacterium]|nr:ygjT1 [Myxococcaceae bacterium]
MLALVVIDLSLVKAKGGTVSVKSAAIWVGVYVVLAMAFAGYLYTLGGIKTAGTFLTVYVIEYALSVDNLFVFLVIFSYFKIKKEAQHRLLYWGVLGAFAMRALLIGLGAQLVTQFVFILYGFGVFLLYTAWKLITTADDEEVDPEKNIILRWSRKVLPVATEDHGKAFFAKEHGKSVVTPLFLVLLVVETSDVLFALDSIPAALGISQDPFIVFTANACAVMGLRSLFFVVSKLMDSFHYLKIGLGIILGFVGIKLILETWQHDWTKEHEGLVIGGSLGFIAVVAAKE